jgi:hypothetical protein
MPTRGPVQIACHVDGQITVATTAAQGVVGAGCGGARVAALTAWVAGVANRFAATERRTVARPFGVIAVRVSRTTGNDVVVGRGRDDAAMVSTRYADVIAASVDSFGPAPTIDASPKPTTSV